MFIMHPIPAVVLLHLLLLLSSSRSQAPPPAPPFMSWSVPTQDFVTAAPVFGSDGSMYVGSWDCNMYCIQASPPEQGQVSSRAPAAAPLSQQCHSCAPCQVLWRFTVPGYGGIGQPPCAIECAASFLQCVFVTLWAGTTLRSTPSPPRCSSPAFCTAVCTPSTPRHTSSPAAAGCCGCTMPRSSSCLARLFLTQQQLRGYHV